MSSPIGVFDSGIGGLTVVKALRDLLPREDIFYIGDTARIPYGSKSPSTVERYSVEIARLLLAENAKAIVVACNSASSVALPRLRAEVSVPVIGVIEPGAMAAAKATRNNRVGVIGTRATIKSGSYEKALREKNASVQVTAQACPLLVPLIEEGWLDDEITDSAIARYLAPLTKSDIDTLVLGCTHYPLLRAAFARHLGAGVTLVDSAQNCAHAVAAMLQEKQIASSNGGKLTVALTDKPDAFLEIARDSLQLDLGEILLRDPTR
ncbi:MAG: glutamate racemase [Verrucomicrobiota bacterium]|nr:glutamate racemase [Verrucomicrobiota bacterium]